MEEDKLVEAKVGVFVFLGLLMVAAIILLLGKESQLFEEQVALKTRFENIGGLKVGAQVRLAGVNVGHVRKISLPTNLKDKTIVVELKVAGRVMEMIRQDSTANIETSGLLGDRIIEISIGSKESPQAQAGTFLESVAPPDFAEVLQKAKRTMDGISRTADTVTGLLEPYNSPAVHQDVKLFIDSLSSITDEVAHGQGFAHSVIYDKQYERRILGLIGSFGQTASELNLAVADVRRLLRAAEKGDGTIHALLYEQKGAKAIEDLGRASENIAAITSAIQNEKGLAHTLIYSQADTNFLAELNTTATDIQEMVTHIKKGDGTVGALIKDPTVYEDLKTVLGNLKRNAILKGVVRFLLDKEDVRRSSEVQAEEP